MPVTPSLAGNTVYAQALIDEGSGFAATNAIEVRLTMPPRLLVATSVLGDTDPVYVVDPVTQTVEHQFNGSGPGVIPAGVSDVTDAEFGFDGTRAYFSQAVGSTATAAGTLGVHELDMTASPPTWTILYSGSGSAHGVGVDDVRARVYALMGWTSSTRELVAVDCRVGSPTYGVAVASTAGVGSPSRWIDRWELSPDGTRAAMVTTFSRELLIVDTDPASPGYMSWNVVGVVPTGAAIATHVTDVDFSPDGQRLIFSINLIGFGSIPGEVARYDLSSASWIDHNGAMPGVQNIGPDSVPPAAVPDRADGIEYAPDGTFAAVSGWGPRSGLGRVDLDPGNALSWSYSLFVSPVDLSGNSYRCAVSPDSAQLATYGSRQLVIFNRDGSHSGTVALPGSGNVYTITWHE